MIRPRRSLPSAGSGRRLLLALLLLLYATAPLAAESGCRGLIEQAATAYADGLFEDARDLLHKCLSGEPKPARDERVEANALLARIELFTDRPAAARQAVAALLEAEPDFHPRSGVEQRFVDLVAEVRRTSAVPTVSSVSKSDEPLREAPATVVVITGEEIERRGYVDLEQLLHNLPGFDISRTNGAVYSSIYQRGFYAPENDRDLLLVDGVEQNDLSSNTVYLSRQYPLTNVDRVEVIYGPASTMYGANAFTGVISVITKGAEDLVAEDKRFGFVAQATGGGYNTRSFDLTLAGQNQNRSVAWSLASRIYHADERDLSGFDDWDYDYDNVDYKSLLRLTGFEAEGFFAAGNCATPSPYFECYGEPFNRTIELTDEGAQLVRELDRKLIRDNSFGFDDQTEDWSVNGKLRIANLTIGLQMWNLREGIASQNKATHITGQTDWAPNGTYLYLRYSRSLAGSLEFSAFVRFLKTGLDRVNSRYDSLHNYSSQLLSLGSLVAPCITLFDPQPVGCPPAPASAWVESVRFGDLSSQLRGEFSVVSNPVEKLRWVAGIELASSSIQSQLDQTASGPGFLFNTNLVDPEQIEHTDIAAYGQASYKLRRWLKVVLAGRLNYNEINNRPGASGFGTLFSPRAALIYTHPAGHLVLKGIYSEAFKDPNDAQKFGVLRFVYEFPSGGLRPEKVRNIEINAGWEKGGLAAEGSLYQADYSDVVALRSVPECDEFFGCLQFANRDELRIRGFQLTARYRRPRFEIWSNYTYTEPFQTAPKDIDGVPLVDPQGNQINELRVADIASNRVNLGLDVDWPGDRFITALRIRYVGTRKTGQGTTVPDNPFEKIEAATTADVTLTYRNLLPGTSLQLAVNNLLDEDYYDPGIEFQIGAPRIPQPGRAIYLRLTWGVKHLP